MGFLDRLQHGWNAFRSRDPTPQSYEIGASYTYRMDRRRLANANDRSIMSALCTRISMDAAAIDIKHVRLDENDRFTEVISSSLNYCLNTEANIDQTSRAFLQDVVMSMLDEGVVAVVPVDTSTNPTITGSYDIETMRTGKIVQWYPRHVRVNVYNDRTGQREDILLPKSTVAIIENPLYAVVNEPNSTLKRLMRKISLLDAIDEKSNSGKLDMIIQLPYVIRTEARRQQAEIRRNDIEKQLTGSKYGIAYTDGTEKIVQLNRPVENNLLDQITKLQATLYAQLGLSEAVINGTADEATMLNYHSRTIEPILSAIVDEMERKFLTKTARTQKQALRFFRDPFKLIPVNEIASIADTFTRNEILSSNEIRAIIGYMPSNDPAADELRNKNLNQTGEEVAAEEVPEEYYEEE